MLKPNHIILKIDEIIDGININAEIKMEVTDIHYNVVLFSPYWRYHVDATGSIAFGSYREKVNSTQIMEFFRLI